MYAPGPGRTFFHHLSSPISFLIATKSFLLAEFFGVASLKWFQNSTFLHGNLFLHGKFAPTNCRGFVAHGFPVALYPGLKALKMLDSPGC